MGVRDLPHDEWLAYRRKMEKRYRQGETYRKRVSSEEHLAKERIRDRIRDATAYRYWQRRERNLLRQRSAVAAKLEELEKENNGE